MQEPDVYERARRRVAELKGFYLHLIAYVLVNIVLAVINFAKSPEYLWFIWPLLGWGIGLVSHALATFGTGPIFGKNWEERKIREYVDKHRKQ